MKTRAENSQVTETKKKAYEFSLLNERIRLRQFDGGKDEQPLVVQQELLKPKRARGNAEGSTTEVEEAHSED